MGYVALKHSHASLAYLTIILFVVRFALFYVSPVQRRNKVLKVLPHVIDTLLLVFAIWLCVVIQQYPLMNGWLTAKVLGLLAYIGFGVVAIRRASKVAFTGAVISFVYVLGVAKTKSILSWLVLLSLG